ncbi:archease [Candidatus Woesearchaeota archaeon]|nr:archease [Candidatus Woesearchaeota archaeon]
MPYKFIDDVSIADVAFEATGEDLNEMFESAGMAVTETMVRNLDKVEQKTEKKVRLESDNIEDLLFNFLQEIIFYKDAEQLLFSWIRAEVKENNGYTLTASLKGEKLDMNKHELIVDVKAVTMHRFEVRKNGKWKAFVVLDI